MVGWIFAVVGGCDGERGDTAPDDTITDTGTPPVTDGTGAVTGVGSRVHPDFPTLLYATWTQSAAADVRVEYSFDEGVWLSSPTQAYDAGDHEQILLGIPYGSDVTFRVVSDLGTSADATASIAALPVAFPDHTLLTLDEAQVDLVNAPYVYTSFANEQGTSTFAAILDREGRVVWALRYPTDRTSLHPRVAKDGRSLFVDYNSFWSLFDRGAESSIDQIRIDGTLIATFDTPGLHHPFTDRPDGSVAYGETVGVYGNEYITVVAPDGSRDRVFDCAAWVASVPDDSACMSNTLNYDAGTDTYLFSLWTSETIVQVDASTGDAIRWFGHTPGSYAFDPPNSAFWWQHGGYLTEDGTLLTSSDKTSNGVETVVREYEIDEATETLHQIWSFGVGEGVYGFQMGEAIRLPSGNTWHNYGELARIREVTPTGEVVWDIEWDVFAVGRSMPLADLYALTP